MVSSQSSIDLILSLSKEEVGATVLSTSWFDRLTMRSGGKAVQS